MQRRASHFIPATQHFLLEDECEIREAACVHVPPEENRRKSWEQSQSCKCKKTATEVDFKIKYKTELCRYWQETGDCIFGDSCAFAHGLCDIRQKKHISSNYKTKKCIQFHQYGFCPYGIRCQFQHVLNRPRAKTFDYAEWLSNPTFIGNFGLRPKRLPIFQDIESPLKMKEESFYSGLHDSFDSESTEYSTHFCFDA
eukprot:TRINITY_DN2154_c0_g1_i8.p1 TRINITY_DN2154_c0_g1~~TRINITY_DN2154_c0_g1_i8.p1  ORF type:complete len:198 (+),score=32.91 TRINITY_DN2154_c0_g1_i8:161-754(+)